MPKGKQPSAYGTQYFYQTSQQMFTILDSFKLKVGSLGSLGYRGVPSSEIGAIQRTRMLGHVRLVMPCGG
jgi:hypothetical protein